ncbi:phosphatase PAP2 family protein, partial [Petrachloros mirabilis]
MSWDESLTGVINSFSGQSPMLDWLALTLSSPSMLWAPGLLLTGYWVWLSWREALIAAPVFGGAIGLLDFIGAQLKHLVARPRPCMVMPDLHQLQACGKVFSFPSNHAVNTATAAAFLQVLYP